MNAIEFLDETISHLKAAQMQRLPSDDEIISVHIDCALKAAREARKTIRDAAREPVTA